MKEMVKNHVTELTTLAVLPGAVRKTLDEIVLEINRLSAIVAASVEVKEPEVKTVEEAEVPAGEEVKNEEVA
jgi:hypothetical protein